ncbi:MAG: mobile mystery protein A [Gemmatimonadota bacterium]
MDEFKQLTRKQLNHKLEPLRRSNLSEVPRGGWSKAIRQALGMSSKALGKRIGVSQSAVSQLESSEEAETITLASLKKLAQGMHCRLVYALVPTSTLDEILLQQAQQRARSIVDSVSTSMDLEDQSVPTEDLEVQIETLTKNLLAKPGSGFWDE